MKLKLTLKSAATTQSIMQFKLTHSIADNIQRDHQKGKSGGKAADTLTKERLMLLYQLRCNENANGKGTVTLLF